MPGTIVGFANNSVMMFVGTFSVEFEGIFEGKFVTGLF